MTLFHRVSTENPQFGGQKPKLCKDNFRGEFPALSNVRYVLTPPILVSDQIQKYQESPRLHELFRIVCANFCLLSCGMSQKTQQRLFRKTCSDELSCFGSDFLGWIFSPYDYLEWGHSYAEHFSTSCFEKLLVSRAATPSGPLLAPKGGVGRGKRKRMRSNGPYNLLLAEPQKGLENRCRAKILEELLLTILPLFALCQ